ncbi:MAG: hypothetical protein RLZZ283_394 [Candidatus Parcubacteria bacterium]
MSQLTKDKLTLNAEAERKTVTFNEVRAKAEERIPVLVSKLLEQPVILATADAAPGFKDVRTVVSTGTEPNPHYNAEMKEYRRNQKANEQLLRGYFYIGLIAGALKVVLEMAGVAALISFATPYIVIAALAATLGMAIAGLFKITRWLNKPKPLSKAGSRITA